MLSGLLLKAWQFVCFIIVMALNINASPVMENNELDPTLVNPTLERGDDEKEVPDLGAGCSIM